MILQRKMTDKEFSLMQLIMRFVDHVHPYIQERVELFGVKPGQTVVDYGCGPGRYTVEFARLVGANGKVIAVDLVEAALLETSKKLEAGGFENFELALAHKYDSGVEANTADTVFAIDMFHHIADTDAFLQEVYRIAKPNGTLILSGGHMLRSSIKSKIAASGLWEISKEHKEFIVYRRKTDTNKTDSQLSCMT